MKKFREKGVGIYLALEYELFFEDVSGEAMRVDGQKFDKILQEKLPSYLCSHLDYQPKPWKMRDAWINSKHFAKGLWHYSERGPDYVPRMAATLAGAVGFDHRFEERYNRMYEIELSTKKPIQNAEAIFRLIDDAIAIPEMVQQQRETLGHTRIQLKAKPYKCTYGYHTAPSQHVNVSSWDMAKAKNKYAPKDNSPSDRALYAYSALTILLRESGLLLYNDKKDFARYRQGVMAPRTIYFSEHKSFEHTVCYRSKDNDPDYSHLENRAFSASEDHYLTIMLTLAALYISECRKDHRSLIQSSKYWTNGSIPENVTEARGRLKNSHILKEVLGDELYFALRREALKIQWELIFPENKHTITR